MVLVERFDGRSRPLLVRLKRRCSQPPTPKFTKQGLLGHTIANLVNLLREPIQVLLKRRLCGLRALAAEHGHRHIRRLFLEHAPLLERCRRCGRPALAFLGREHRVTVRAEVVFVGVSSAFGMTRNCDLDGQLR
jgi:hypothetical protein